jgi:hypothetical protein
MPQTMTSPPLHLDTASLLRAARGKRGLVLGVGILLAALLGAWYASAQLKPGASPAPEKPGQMRAGLDRATLDTLDLSTFQRRGTLLVGEVTTPAGVRLRLVLDATSRELVGLRVVETEAGASR